MFRKIFFYALSIMAMSLAIAEESSSILEIEENVYPKENEYVMYIDIFDWGAAVNKIVFNAGKIIKENKIDAEDFSVDITVNATAEGAKTGTGVVKGHRTVTDAYICDPFGNKLADSSKEKKSAYIALELKVEPEGNSNNLLLNIPLIDKFDQIYGFRIKNSRLNLTIKKRTAVASPIIKKFKNRIYQEENKEDYLSYSYWIPEKKESKIPLIIWLHGQGGASESNKYQALMETKAVNLIGNDIQKYFDNGAAVLIPQCNSSWLVTNSTDSFGNKVWATVKIHEIAEKITRPFAKIFDKIFSTDKEAEKELEEHFASVSYYTEPLANLINDFIKENPCIDESRIYIGGNSAGGYMTLNMCIQYPDLFAAAFTASEAMLDEKIIDSQIKILRDIPMWFVYSEKDDTIEAKEYAEPTTKRLLAADAKDLHISKYTQIKDEELNFEYDPHYSWIYMLNNKCEDNGITLFEWLSKKSNGNVRTEEQPSTEKKEKQEGMIII